MPLRESGLQPIAAKSIRDLGNILTQAAVCEFGSVGLRWDRFPGVQIGIAEELRDTWFHVELNGAIGLDFGDDVQRHSGVFRGERAGLPAIGAFFPFGRITELTDYLDAVALFRPRGHT